MVLITNRVSLSACQIYGVCRQAQCPHAAPQRVTRYSSMTCPMPMPNRCMAGLSHTLVKSRTIAAKTQSYCMDAMGLVQWAMGPGAAGDQHLSPPSPSSHGAEGMLAKAKALGNRDRGCIRSGAMPISSSVSLRLLLVAARVAAAGKLVPIPRCI